MREPAIDALVNLSLAVLARGELVHPHALALLLREYAETGRDDVGDAVGAALARAIDRPDRPGSDADWLMLFIEAISLADDPRLLRAAQSTAAALRATWPRQASVREAMRSIDACIHLTRAADEAGLLPAAVDELERVVGLTYSPGAGIRHAIGDDQRGDLGDHAGTASALLTAYAASQRLPYAMLADDLMQFARRCWWDDDRGGFQGDTSTADGLAAFLDGCSAVRVLCQLTVLHRDPGYRESAIFVEGRDHAADARRALDRLAPSAAIHGIAGALYGLAFGDCADLQ